MLEWITDKLTTLAFITVVALVIYLIAFWVFDVDLIGKYNPSAVQWSQKTLQDKEIGFREDGVVVWREID
jgi:hypothetical protein